MSDADRLPAIAETAITAASGHDTSWAPLNEPAANVAAATPLIAVPSTFFTPLSLWMSPRPSRPSTASMRMPMPAPK